MTTSAVVLHSGGLDSSTLLYDVLQHHGKVYPLTMNYGQRHEREIVAAYKIARAAGVGDEWKLIDLTPLTQFLGGSALTNPDIPVPQGLYDDESMQTTVVPNRNMILLSIAAGFAQSIGASFVYTAVHSGDHAIYADCRPEFLEACSLTVSLATDNKVSIIAPYALEDKTYIAQLASKLAVPIENTWSCYEGKRLHCGKCGTCVERIEAIYNAGFVDPTEYEPGGYEYAIDLLTVAGKINESE